MSFLTCESVYSDPNHEDTGWRSAVIYTLIENVRREKLDPFAYLQWVFEKIPQMTNRDDLRTILPKAWIERQRTGKHLNESSPANQAA